MSDILQKLKESGNARTVVALDGHSIGLRILNDEDYLEADFAVIARMKEKEIEFATESADAFEHEKSTQLLFRALVDPETGKPLSKSVTEIRKSLSREQKAYLINAYLEFEKERSPKEETMEESEFQALLEVVKKKPELTSLSDLNIATLKKLILSLASQPAD